mgnify:CR=1 FL=1
MIPERASESILVAPRETSGAILTLELSEDLLTQLQTEHMRLSNPSPLSWDRFLTACLVFGLDEMERTSAEQLLSDILEEEER